MKNYEMKNSTIIDEYNSLSGMCLPEIMETAYYRLSGEKSKLLKLKGIALYLCRNELGIKNREYMFFLLSAIQKMVKGKEPVATKDTVMPFFLREIVTPEDVNYPIHFYIVGEIIEHALTDKPGLLEKIIKNIRFFLTFNFLY